MARRAFAVFAAVFLARSPSQAQIWTVSDKPVVTIGQAEGEPEYMLHQVAHARRLGNGRILLTIGPDIRYYDAQGKYVGKAGGRGRGPGEFTYISDLYVLRGDTLLALNFRNKVWLTADGKFVRQEAVDFAPLNEAGWFSEGATLLPNGNLLGAQYPREVPGDPRMRELHRPRLRYAILDVPSGKVTHLVESGGLRQMLIGERNSAVQPFSPHARHAIGVDRVYAGDNDSTFIGVFALDGKALGKLQITDRAIPVSDQDLSEYRRSWLRSVGENAERKTAFEQGWAAVPKPKRFPFWGTASVDNTGNLWVSDPQRPQRIPNGWSVFDRNGRRIARVTMPAGFTPREIGSDYVLGVTRDEFDVEYVHMYALSKRAR
jgi:hypothetical protein